MPREHKIHYYIVKGEGAFPLDMLRYSQCWPARERDSYLIAESLESFRARKEEYKIHLASHRDNLLMDIARWLSYHYNIIDGPRDYVRTGPVDEIIHKHITARQS